MASVKTVAVILVGGPTKGTYLGLLTETETRRDGSPSFRNFPRHGFLSCFTYICSWGSWSYGPFALFSLGSLDLELIFSVAWVEGHDGRGWFFFRWWVGLLYRYQVPTTFFQSCQAFIPSCRPANGAPSNSCMPKGTIQTCIPYHGKKENREIPQMTIRCLPL